MSAKTAKKLSPGDLKRHKRMLGLLENVRTIQAEIDLLVGRRNELLAAWKVWGEELHDRYGLASDGSEGVDQHGAIRRNTAAHPDRAEAQ